MDLKERISFIFSDEYEDHGLTEYTNFLDIFLHLWYNI